MCWHKQLLSFELQKQIEINLNYHGQYAWGEQNREYKVKRRDTFNIEASWAITTVGTGVNLINYFTAVKNLLYKGGILAHW